MGAKATPVDPMKSFHFLIEIDDLEAAYVQEVTLPKCTHGVVEHTGAGDDFSTKTPGKSKVDNLTLTKVVPINGNDSWAWDWFRLARDPTTGKGVGADELKKDIKVHNLNDAGEIVRSWEYEGGWVVEFDPGKLDTKSESDAVIESVTISVDRPKMTQLK